MFFSLSRFVLFLTLLFVFSLSFPLTTRAQQCCTNADCGGQTCLNPPVGCGPERGYGSCTGGGTECGWGAGAGCPGGYTCVSGNCCLNGNCAAPTPPSGGGGGGGGIGESCSSDADCASGRCSAQRGICVDAGGFICPEDPVYCPSGTVRTATVTRYSCLNPKCTAGSAQTIGNCCSGHWNKGACSDWYDCPTRNNPNKVCRDCEDDEFVCTTQEYITYQCLPVCSTTSPSNVVATPISITSSRVTWTPGNTNICQAIYVSRERSKVVYNPTDKPQSHRVTELFLIVFLRVSVTPWLGFPVCSETHLPTFSAPMSQPVIS